MSVDINIVWTMAAALLIYFMHGGFGFFEAGMCRTKNTVDTLSHNLMILAVTIVVFWAFGFGLMFGDGNEFVGLSGFVPDLLEDGAKFASLAKNPVPLAVACAFVMSFADTPATLIAGTGAERIRFCAVMSLTVLISGVLFPIVGHWLLGGGWLSKLSTPVYDTGSGMVHLCGGCCALAVAMLLGERQDVERLSGQKTGKLKKVARSKTFARKSGEKAGADPLASHVWPPVKAEPEKQVSSMPLVFLGAFILWLGFFAFNSAFSMTASSSIGLIVVNTALGGAAGSVTAMIGAFVLTGKAPLRTTIIGLLTANVAITSAAGVIEPWGAATIGAIAGIFTVLSIPFWMRLRLDDPTEYLTMNVVGGIIGLVSVGLFVSPTIVRAYAPRPEPKGGLLYTGDWGQLWSQLIALGAIVGFVLPCALAGCWILRRMHQLRVPPEEERQGSDQATHGEKAYEGDPQQK